MREKEQAGFLERLKAAAEARQARLAKFRPRPAVPSPEPSDRAAARDAELAQVRHDRAAAKAAKIQAAADASQAAQAALEASEAASLEARRGERKERKALTKAEAKLRRDLRYAARKARK
ncbi:MAG: hypothetical protein KGO51_07015 [Alphaproteobacteria bacterium]|nr:hypothetical protein [Alphaproteobacteria bacterium]